MCDYSIGWDVLTIFHFSATFPVNSQTKHGDRAIPCLPRKSFSLVKSTARELTCNTTRSAFDKDLGKRYQYHARQKPRHLLHFAQPQRVKIDPSTRSTNTAIFLIIPYPTLIHACTHLITRSSHARNTSKATRANTHVRSSKSKIPQSHFL